MYGCNGPIASLAQEYALLDTPQEPQLDDGGQQSAPHTPEIISSIISMVPPRSNYSDLSTGSYGDLTSDEAHLTSSPQPSSAGSPGTPVFGPSSPPGFGATVQSTRSHLIKEGLKLTIQSRRLVHGLDQIRPDFHQASYEQLTPEDEERRRRRRERNKVAATKCRNKKKEQTTLLAVESESLSVDNCSLRHEIQELEAEKHKLLELLRHHLPICGLPAPRNSCAQAQNSQQCSAVLG